VNQHSKNPNIKGIVDGKGATQKIPKRRRTAGSMGFEIRKEHMGSENQECKYAWQSSWCTEPDSVMHFNENMDGIAISLRTT